ncbi:PAS domain S-box protein [Curvibacter sp. CHRR-16]|uniref:PAS domain-containing sensor histidine kinase n=1 Tax=Curvibacter sp. CHRR-16 TaxID=2835872 RepID=UPI001BD9EC2E|nr:PAS domain S-box protein [Curvibacter sp. CHRR-16]MBT0569012.1 PAS domain S-box protein [Curvibacter sp. CHRR-16]
MNTTIPGLHKLLKSVVAHDPSASAHLQQMQAILNTTGEAIMELDAKGRIQSINPAAASMFGRGEEMLHKKALEQVIYGMRGVEIAPQFVGDPSIGYKPRRVMRHDLQGIRADGTLFPVEVSLGEIQLSGSLRYACVVRDLTDERAAQETSELYQRALSSSHNAVFITDARQTGMPIVYINDAFQRLMELPRHQIVGTSLNILRQGMHTDMGLSELMLAVQEERSATSTIRRNLPNGQLQVAEVTLSPVSNDRGELTHFVGIASDITERVQAQEAIAQRRAQLDAIFNLSPDGFVMFDADDNLAFVNPAFERMTGWVGSSPDMVGSSYTLRDFSAWLYDLCDAKHTTVQAMDTPNWQARLHLLRPQARVLQAQSQRKVDGRGETIFYFRDVTHEDAVDRMKSEFLTAAAHELRTPMVSIFGFTELLIRRKYSPERQADMLETIHKQSGLLVKMINELLDLARIESRRGMDMHITPHPIAEVVQASIQALLLKEGDRQISVEELPDLMVLADPEKMTLALSNLLSNALKYSPNGGEVHLRVGLQDNDGKLYAMVEIKDHGIGMTPEQLARAFERFYRADASGNIPGTGLGLSLVKEIVELHQGFVELDSTYGQGTTARVHLPVK